MCYFMSRGQIRIGNGLIKLFQDIDINGDGHMEWAEFT